MSKLKTDETIQKSTNRFLMIKVSTNQIKNLSIIHRQPINRSAVGIPYKNVL